MDNKEYLSKEISYFMNKIQGISFTDNDLEKKYWDIRIALMKCLTALEDDIAKNKQKELE